MRTATGLPTQALSRLFGAIEHYETAKAFNAEDRKRYAAEGVAMPDGSYPIRNPEDLHNAYMDWIRTGRSSAVRAHLEQRAKALGVKLPDQN